MAFNKVGTSSYYDSGAYRLNNCYVPTGTQNGDLMFAVIAKGLASNINMTVPTGWTRIGNAYAGNMKNELYWRIASSEGTPYTFGNDTDVKSRMRVTIISYRGDYNSSSLIGAISNTLYGDSDNIVRAASMSVPSSNSILLFFATVYDTAASYTFTKPSVPTTGWIEDFDGGDGSSDMYQEICSMIWSSSGATGNIDATLSAAYDTRKHAFAVALNPPSLGPANLKSYNTNLKANIKTINTNPIANVKSLNTNV